LIDATHAEDVTVTDSHEDRLAQSFEANRPHLRAVAYRMLGSTAEADDVVQDAWLRLSRSDVSAVENLRGWLTTVVARLSLDALRVRKSRHERAAGLQLPEPVVTDAADGPEESAVLADSVGVALLVVLDTLSPAERLAFVLHDVFGLPFDEIAPIVERTPVATRQLASRARRRVRGSRTTSDTDMARQRAVADAFTAASRDGDFERLLSVLDPDVVVRADFGAGRPDLSREIRGARAVAEQALAFRALAPGARPATVNGGAGAIVFSGGRLYAILAFTIRNQRIVEIDIFADPARLSRYRELVSRR
jgi:RNA polymerase sigma-70 factor, ECF subfamily